MIQYPVDRVPCIQCRGGPGDGRRLRGAGHAAEKARVKTASGTGPETSSTNSDLTANLVRREGLTRVLKNVIETMITLILSMIGYVVSCIVGELASNRTPIFEIHKGQSGPSPPRKSRQSRYRCLLHRCTSQIHSLNSTS